MLARREEKKERAALIPAAAVRVALGIENESHTDV